MLMPLEAVFSSIMSESPQVPAGNGKAVSDGVSGKELDFPGLKPSQPKTQEASPSTDAPPVRQPSPSDANVVLDDATFYVMDANDPEGSRTVGLQVREAFHRARQVDTLQSQLHTTQNEKQSLQQQLATANASIKEFETEAAVSKQLASMGVSAPPAQGTSSAVPANQQPGVLTPQGTPQGDSWDYDAGTPGVWGHQEQPATPAQTPQQQPVPQTQNVSPSNPQEFARQLSEMIGQAIDQKLGNVQSLVQDANKAGLEQLQQERAVQDRITSTFQADRQVRAESLERFNLSPERTNNILDLEDMATVLREEAGRLLSEGSPENVTIAQSKLRQAAGLQSTAVTDRAAAQIAFQSTEAERQYEQNIERNPFAARGVEEREIDYDLTRPADIDKFVEDNARDAAEMAEAQARIESQTGRTP